MDLQIAQVCRRNWSALRDNLSKRFFRLVGHRHFVGRVRHEQPGPVASSRDGRIFVDISAITENDARTGIQRVVRSVATGLISLDRPKHQQPILICARDGHYFVAQTDGNRFVATLKEAQFVPGDIFMGLDFSLNEIWRMRYRLRAMRRSGVRFWFVIYDLLPISNPDWFSAPLVLRFHNWLAIIAALSDGFFCISLPVAQELRETLRERYSLVDSFELTVVPMGADFALSHPTVGLPAGFDRLLAGFGTSPVILMVGTIEPRKGHADVVEAMRHLWAQGSETQLVLVGGQGWETNDFVTALTGNREIGRRLHWLGNVSDEALGRLYDAASGIICASFAEGFGLPVIEALAHDKPVLARDLEVFHIHRDKGVTFFPTDAGPIAIADAIDRWIQAGPPAPAIGPDEIAGWTQTAQFIAAKLDAQLSERTILRTASQFS